MSTRCRSWAMVSVAVLGAGLAGELRAAPDEVIHPLRFRIHVNLIEPEQGRDLDFWKERLRLSLERANLALQGRQGGTDIACCARIEPLEVVLETFGSTRDGYDIVTSSSTYRAIQSRYRTGVYIVLSLEACGATVNPGIVGCASIDGNFIVVDVVDDDNGSNPASFATNFEYLGLTIAHERGHNAGLDHDDQGTCNLMAPTVGGGCLDVEQCQDYLAKGTELGGECSCMGEFLADPPLPDGSPCGEPGSCGVCSGAVCGGCEGDAGVGIFAVADTTTQSGGSPDDLVRVSALTGDWRRLEPPLPSELSGLAYDSRRDVFYGVGPGESGADRLVVLLPTRGVVRRELPLDCSGTTLDCEPIVALAYDAHADLLYGVHPGNQYLDQTKSCSDCVNNLIAIDPRSGVVTHLGEPDYLHRDILGLAYDSEAGILYGASEDDIIAIDLEGCGPFDPCPFTYVAATGKPVAGLSIDPRNGRLHLLVNRTGDLTYRVIDPASPRSEETGLVAPDFTVRVDSVGVAGLAARPVPAPSAGLLRLAALGVLALGASLRRRRPRGGLERRGGWRSLVIGLVASLALLAGGSRVAVANPADEIALAEGMVRARYYEGLPEERARDCSERCAAHLVEMLEDPGEVRHHANVLRVLGFSPHPGAYEALAAFAAREPRGDVSGAAYNARVEVMLALGNTARRDPRALQLLFERVERAPRAPGWSAGPMRGEALRTAIRRGAMRGLALSGRPEAGVRLRAMEAAANARTGQRGQLRGLRAALELHGRSLLEQVARGLETPEEGP